MESCKINKRGDDLGSLTVGNKADIAVLSLDSDFGLLMQRALRSRGQEVSG